MRCRRGRGRSVVCCGMRDAVAWCLPVKNIAPDIARVFGPINGPTTTTLSILFRCISKCRAPVQPRPLGSAITLGSMERRGDSAATLRNRHYRQALVDVRETYRPGMCGDVTRALPFSRFDRLRTRHCNILYDSYRCPGAHRRIPAADIHQLVTGTV